MTTTHERVRPEEPIAGSSDRSFGVVFAVVFALAGIIPAWDGRPLRLWALLVSASFASAALFVPRLLHPLNRVWQRVGLALHRVVSPIVLAVLFYLIVTPFGLLTRALGKGLARRLRPDASVPSYWIDRAGQPPSHMDQQF
jgi:hypothetical protein